MLEKETTLSLAGQPGPDMSDGPERYTITRFLKFLQICPKFRILLELQKPFPSSPLASPRRRPATTATSSSDGSRRRPRRPRRQVLLLRRPALRRPLPPGTNPSPPHPSPASRDARRVSVALLTRCSSRRPRPGAPPPMAGRTPCTSSPTSTSTTCNAPRSAPHPPPPPPLLSNFPGLGLPGLMVFLCFWVGGCVCEQEQREVSVEVDAAGGEGRAAGARRRLEDRAVPLEPRLRGRLRGRAGVRVEP